MARAVQQGDYARLQELCPPAVAALANVSTPMVWLIVDDVEHALALKDCLRDWRIGTGLSINVGGLTCDQRRQVMAGRSPFLTSPGPCIVTGAGMEEADLSQVDVLIRADGGTGLPPITHEQLAQAHTDCRPLLIVDFQDRHHPELRRRSRQRRPAYARRGWFPVGVEPAQARVNQFLAQRI